MSVISPLVRARFWCETCRRWGAHFLVAEDRWNLAVGHRLEDHKASGCRSGMGSARRAG